MHSPTAQSMHGCKKMKWKHSIVGGSCTSRAANTFANHTAMVYYLAICRACSYMHVLLSCAFCRCGQLSSVKSGLTSSS